MQNVHEERIRGFISFLCDNGLVGLKSVKTILDCFDFTFLNNKDHFKNLNYFFKLVLMKYLKSTILSRTNNVLEHVCEDIITKYNENVQIERIKKMKILYTIFKYKLKFTLLKKINIWNRKAKIIREKDMLHFTTNFNLKNNVNHTNINVSSNDKNLALVPNQNQKTVTQSSPEKNNLTTRGRPKNKSITLNQNKSLSTSPHRNASNTSRSVDIKKINSLYDDFKRKKIKEREMISEVMKEQGVTFKPNCNAYKKKNIKVEGTFEERNYPVNYKKVSTYITKLNKKNFNSDKSKISNPDFTDSMTSFRRNFKEEKKITTTRPLDLLEEIYNFENLYDGVSKVESIPLTNEINIIENIEEKITARNSKEITDFLNSHSKSTGIGISSIEFKGGNKYT